MAEQKREQLDGNKRFLCPACRQPSIQPITLPITGYICPISGLEVSATTIKAAPVLANEDDPPKKKTLLEELMTEPAATPPDENDLTT